MLFFKDSMLSVRQDVTIEICREAPLVPRILRWPEGKEGEAWVLLGHCVLIKSLYKLAGTVLGTLWRMTHTHAPVTTVLR